jgi:hypothetical protein
MSSEQLRELIAAQGCGKLEAEILVLLSPLNWRKG